MKKNSIYFLAIIFIGSKAYGQQVLPASSKIIQEPYNFKYSSNHKTLKTAGWISLGTGVPLFCLGVALGIGSADNQNGASAERTSKWMIPSGAALALASIPCFIISHHHRNKEASISLVNQEAFFLQKNGVTSNIQPMLSLKIPL